MSYKNMTIPQMILNLNLREDASLTNFFVSGENRQLLNCIHKMAHGRGEQFLYFWGKEKVGKTHLLHGSCHAINRLKLSGFYFSFKNLEGIEPSVLEDLEKLNLVCIDDVDQMVDHADWEEMFFDLLNRMREEQKRLIVVGDKPPNQLNIQMPDIKSRLSQALIFQLFELTDVEKMAAMQVRAKSLGLKLSKTVLEFLLNHCPRDMGSLFSALEKLDQASLQAQRKLTIPFAKEILSL